MAKKKTASKKAATKRKSPANKKAAKRKSKQHVYFFGGNKADGDGSQKALLGGKGANLSDLGLGQKIALSKFLDKKSGKIEKIAKRLVKGIRKKELMKKRKPIVKSDKKGIPQKKAS